MTTPDSNDAPIINASAGQRFTIANTELLDTRRAINFAASINERNPAYFDDTRPGGLMVHPAIAYSFQYNSQTRLGIPPQPKNRWIGVVHAETDIRFMRPFRTGQVITTQGRLVTRKQIKSGVYNVDRYQMCDGDGETLAEMDFVLIFRGALLEGGDRAFEQTPARPTPPEAPADPLSTIEMFIPPLAPHHYTAGSGIYAAIHTEKSVANAAGFPDVILQGSATKSMALSEIANQCFDGDATRISRLYGQLRAIVLTNTTIRLQINSIVEEDGERQVFFQVLNANGEPAIDKGLVVGR